MFNACWDSISSLDIFYKFQTNYASRLLHMVHLISNWLYECLVASAET